MELLDLDANEISDSAVDDIKVFQIYIYTCDTYTCDRLLLAAVAQVGHTCLKVRQRHR